MQKAKKLRVCEREPETKIRNGYENNRKSAAKRRSTFNNKEKPGGEGSYAIAFIRDDSRDILRAAVFL